MPVEIQSVKRFSRSWFAGVRAGDRLLTVDGYEIEDVLDYDFRLSFAPVTAVFQCGDKQKTVQYKTADTGLQFATYLMDKQQHCKNKCIFCFIDQLPAGMRESLYFKDDDSRLSFLFGNYITLTNISEHEIERIIQMHISPVNISVHTMNPQLRVEMMKNPHAGEALSVLQRFADAGITMNTQLVLCPGFNDGKELEYSLQELAKLYPAVQSIAAVPVGLTKFREGLCPLKPYTKETAGEVIDILEAFSTAFKAQHGVRLCYPADEFFLKAERPLPNGDYYDGYPQIDNGVGLWTSLQEEFYEALSACTKKSKYKQLTLATGVAAYPLLQELCAAAQAKIGCKIEVVKIINRFFGEQITVAGLLTGKDLLEQLKDRDLGEALLIPLVMTIDYTSHSTENNKFLDDITLKEAEKVLGVPVIPTGNVGKELLSNLLGV
ncbi:MAG: DUF512 domain-containing protein [Candidatus Fimenecus sp.]